MDGSILKDGTEKGSGKNACYENREKNKPERKSEIVKRKRKENAKQRAYNRGPWSESHRIEEDSSLYKITRIKDKHAHSRKHRKADAMTGRTTTMMFHAKKVLEELKKDPGKHTREMEKTTGLREGAIRKILILLEASEEHETKKLMAKRAAYSRGGTYLAKQITKEPGSGYRAIDTVVREGCEKDRVKRAETEELFKWIIEYCKKWKDAELKEILLKHKNAGGWMP